MKKALRNISNTFQKIGHEANNHKRKLKKIKKHSGFEYKQERPSICTVTKKNKKMPQHMSSYIIQTLTNVRYSHTRIRKPENPYNTNINSLANPRTETKTKTNAKNEMSMLSCIFIIPHQISLNQVLRKLSRIGLFPRSKLNCR